MRNRTRDIGLMLAVLVIAAGLGGCKDEDGEVRTYQTEKAAPAVTVTASAPPIQPGLQDPPSPQAPVVQVKVDTPPPSGPYAWVLPEGWTDGPAKPMRLATFMIPLDQKQVECSLSAFPGPAGGVVANVNRWRGQVGLPPADAATIESSAIKVRGNLGDFQYFKLINDAQADKAFLAAILPGGDRTVFVKIIDAPLARLETLESSFVEFCQSLSKR